MWVGWVKIDTWDYCLKGIKDDIAKNVLRSYFSGMMRTMYVDRFSKSPPWFPEMRNIRML